MYENKVVLGLIRVHILHHSTIYPILHEMEGDGVIRSEKVVSNGRVRKVYRITPKGREVLRELLGYVRELSDEVL